MKNLKIHKKHYSRNKFLAPLFIILGILLAANAGAANTNQKLCFSTTNTPVVDGDVLNDPAWGVGQWQYGSWKYIFGNGSNIPNGVVQGTKNNSQLYFAFEINNDNTFDSQDAVILIIDPPGLGALPRKFQIKPLCAGVGACPGGQASEVKVTEWNGASWVNALINPAWVETGVDSTNGAPNIWSLEVSIPYSQVAVPASGLFGLYFNIIRVDSVAGTALQMDWPVDAVDIAGNNAGEVSFFLETGVPPETQWGHGTRGGVTCNGVSIGSMDIKTNQTPNSKISLNQNNFFTATVHNSSIDGSGTPIGVTGVRATFKIANWGIPALDEWAAVPAANNTPSGNIVASGSTDLVTGVWLLDATEQVQYAAPNTHQCIRVELDNVGAGNISFLNEIAYRNMDFEVTASPVRRQAQIGTKGYKLPAGSEQHTMILREFFYNTPKDARWKSEISGVQSIDREKGVYKLNLKPDETRKISTAVTPPKINIPIEVVDVLPGTGGINEFFTGRSGKPSLMVPVRSGNVITLIASGSIEKKVGGQPVIIDPIGSPGIPTVLNVKASVVINEVKLLAKGAALGSLVGSFDNFITSFPVGSAVTVRVPKAARYLYLAVNDYEGEYENHFGKGFSVQVTQTAAKPEYMSVGQIIPADGQAGNVALPLGSNLPTWVMCGELMTGKKISIDGTVFDVVENAGCFGYMIKDNSSSNAGNPAPCGCFDFSCYFRK